MNLLIKDNFFTNPDVLRRMALDCNYINAEDVSVDVGWRGHRTDEFEQIDNCLLYTSPSPRDESTSRMPSSA